MKNPNSIIEDCILNSDYHKCFEYLFNMSSAEKVKLSGKLIQLAIDQTNNYEKGQILTILFEYSKEIPNLKPTYSNFISVINRVNYSYDYYDALGEEEREDFIFILNCLIKYGAPFTNIIYDNEKKPTNIFKLFENSYLTSEYAILGGIDSKEFNYGKFNVVYMYGKIKIAYVSYEEEELPCYCGEYNFKEKEFVLFRGVKCNIIKNTIELELYDIKDTITEMDVAIPFVSKISD